MRAKKTHSLFGSYDHLLSVVHAVLYKLTEIREDVDAAESSRRKEKERNL